MDTSHFPSYREEAEPSPPTPGPCPRTGLTLSEYSGLPAARTLWPLALSLLEQPPLAIGRRGCTNTPAPSPLRRDTEAWSALTALICDPAGLNSGRPD